MGFDSIASQAIMFIAVLGASAMLIVAFDSQLSTTSDAMATQQDALTYQIKTNINIETANYNNSAPRVTFYARNTGKTALKIDKLSIYVSNTWIGNATSSRNVTVLPDTMAAGSSNENVWDPNEVIMGNLSIALSPGSVYTLRIISQYQTEETFEFTA
jgi:archaellum component FlaF (FlaF/FlaG flagellin family)